jgi:hypothetical protein
MRMRALLVTISVLLVLLAPSAAHAAFGIDTLSVKATDPDGSVDTTAGSHPDLTVSIGLNLKPGGEEEAEGQLEALYVHLPAGVVGDVQNLQTCPRSVFASAGQCPPDTVVGVAHVVTAIEPQGGDLAIYNLAPALGSPATLGGTLFELNSFQEASVRSETDFGVDISDVTLPAGAGIKSIEEVVWGRPWESRHDEARGETSINSHSTGAPSPYPLEGEPLPFINLPTSCSTSLKTTVELESLEEPGVRRSALVGSLGGPGQLTGCGSLAFEPTISTEPTSTHADSPTGLSVSIHQPQESRPPLAQGTLQSCEPGVFSAGSATASYQWLRNGVPVPGATGQSYALQSSDLDASVQCEETVENVVGSTRATSRPVLAEPDLTLAPPTPEQPVPGGSQFPRLVFRPTTGTFECQAGLWSEAAVLSYSWFKNGVPVGGQTGTNYTVPAAELPTAVQCEVTGSNTAGATSVYTITEHSEPPPSTTPPLLEGFPVIVPAGEYPHTATAALDTARVTLPEGMTLNPSAANGLGSCSEAQVGRLAVPGIHFDKTPNSCPDSSKVGTAEVITPLLDHPLKGAVYVATPFHNPFGSLLAIYLVIEDELSGTYAKLAGKVEPDPQTGRLTATFSENPQLPLEDIHLSFFGGNGAALKTPLACGTYTTTTTLTPWSAPEAPSASPSSSFAVSGTASGQGSCPTSEAQAPKEVGFEAGTTSPIAGSYSPFVLKLTRPDGSQHITGIQTTLPEGLLGRLAGVAYCPESGIAQAKSREATEQGKVEQSSPSCPSSSEVGTVTVGAGAGGTPFYASGHVYLAGPYKGAPLSLVVIVPAVAGPFDLGDVVTRVALNVAPYSAQIEAVSDPLPTILQGIPLDIRSIALNLDRPSFTLNPTSCEQKQIEGSVSTQAGQSAPLKNAFAVGGCGSLAFKPKLAISLKGPTKRTGHPALKATVTYPKGGGYANIARAQVSLPHSEFLDQGNLNLVCKQAELAAGTCPKKAIYGKVKAWTPLLDKPLEGNVYLGVGFGYKLPAMVAELDGQIRVLLKSKVDTDKQKGIRSTFEAVPDAQIEKFTLELKGGKKYGLLENSEDICRKTQKAGASFTAQNGKTLQLSPVIANSCGKEKGSKGKHGKAKGKGKNR